MIAAERFESEPHCLIPCQIFAQSGLTNPGGQRGHRLPNFESKIKAALFISGVLLMITMIIFSRSAVFCSEYIFFNLSLAYNSKLYPQFTLSHVFNRNTFVLHLIYFIYAFASVYIVSNKNLHNNTTSNLLLIGNTTFQFSFKNVLFLSAEAASRGIL